MELSQENAPFEPDWGDDKQEKHCVFYDNTQKTLDIYYWISCQHQFTLPYFKSKRDCKEFIEACKEHLTLLFTK